MRQREAFIYRNRGICPLSFIHAKVYKMNYKKSLLVVLSKTGTLPLALSVYQKISKNRKGINTSDRQELVVWNYRPSVKTIFVDISSLVALDHGGGIQRVQRSLVQNWGSFPPESYDVCPIYFSETEERFMYVSTEQVSSWHPSVRARAGIVEMSKGDIYLNADLNYRFIIEHEDFYPAMREHGVHIYFMTYDLLPLLMPNAFTAGIDEFHKKWFEVAAQHSKLVCISKSVATEAIEWGSKKGLPVRATSIDLGADLSKLQPLTRKPGPTSRSKSQVSFLIVSTIEIRKGHEQVLDAFELLWDQGIDVTLTLVGRRGWKVDELLERISSHEHINKKLFWLSDLDDEQLTDVYRNSTALVNASIGEGFGLPLVEASAHGLPLILRDIPIFREIAGDTPWYFATKDPLELAESIKSWLREYSAGNIKINSDIKIVSWKETCDQLIDIFMSDLARLE